MDYWHSDEFGSLRTIMSEDGINQAIIRERSELEQKLSKDTTDIRDIFNEVIDKIIQADPTGLDGQLEQQERAIGKSVQDLNKSYNITKNKIESVRNVGLVVTGGIVGSIGLLLGPLIGSGTIIAGISAGGLIAKKMTDLSLGR